MLHNKITKNFPMSRLNEAMPKLYAKVLISKRKNCLAEKKDWSSWDAGYRNNASKPPHTLTRHEMQITNGNVMPNDTTPTSVIIAIKRITNIAVRTRPGS